MKYSGEGISLAPGEIDAELIGMITAESSRIDLSSLHFSVITLDDHIITVCSPYKDFCCKPEFVSLSDLISI